VKTSSARCGPEGQEFCSALNCWEAIVLHDPPLIAALCSAVSDLAVTDGFKSCKQIDIDLKKGREFHILIKILILYGHRVRVGRPKYSKGAGIELNIAFR
jgi:hypothetical protein